MSEIVELVAAGGVEMGSLGEEHKVPRLRMISQKARDHAALGMTRTAGLRMISQKARDRALLGITKRERCGKCEQSRTGVGHAENLASAWHLESSRAEERERRTYRGRTINMLRRYMRYSIDTGRLPSVLGREFFRARVSARSAITFEDRVIYVHDMETSLNKLDEFSRQIIARHILQEHDQEATARLLHCGTRTVQRYIPLALDLLSEILLDVGLLERTLPVRENACQGGKTNDQGVSGS